MDRRDPDNYEAPRRTRRIARAKQGGAALFLVVILGVVVLLGAGGAVGALLYLKHARTPTPAADSKPADKSPNPADQAAKLTELSDRFVGQWEGESPERPSLKVYYEVTRDRVTLTAYNFRTKEWGDKPIVSTWRPLEAKDNTLIVHQDFGERGKHESVVTFTSDDAMSVRSRESGKLVANFRRAGKK